MSAMPNRRQVMLGAAAATVDLRSRGSAPAVAWPRPRNPVGWLERRNQRSGAVVTIYYPALSAPVVMGARGVTVPTGHAEDLTRRFGPEAARMLVDARSYASYRAPIVGGRIPVLIFAPGFRFTSFDYRALLESLASEGFMVVCTSPPTELDPGAAADEIRGLIVLLEAWIAATGDRLGAAIDRRAVGAFGHSIGGAAATLAASADPTIVSAVNLDGDFIRQAQSARPTQPILYMTSEDAHEPIASRMRRARTWGEVSALSTGPVALRIEGFGHLNFVDAAFASNAIPAERRQGRFGNIAPDRGLAIVSGLLVAFFGEHLCHHKGALAAALTVTPEATRR